MSEGEFKKIRLHLRLLTVCVIVLIALLTADLIHRNFSPKSTAFPRVVVVKGAPGKDAVVDYGAIDQHIDNKIASLPKPQNGVNGTNGASGQQGPQGITGVPGATGQIGVTGTQGTPGKNGADGIDGLILQVQVDPITCQLESKYTVADDWTILAQLPTPCEAL